MQQTRNKRILHATIVAGMLALVSLDVLAEEVAARLDWAELHYASVPVEGFVDSVMVREGQHVSKGDKLLQLNTTVLTAKVKQSRARVAALLPALADAKREYNDAQVLYEQTVLSDVELQRAKMGFDIASARRDEAEAMLAADLALLARATQYAPWDGWVIERRVETGQVVVGDERSKPLLTLARADKRVAEADISYAQRARLSVGQAVKVRYLDKTRDATIQSIAPAGSVKSSGESWRLRVEFAVDPAQLYPRGAEAAIILP